MNLDAPTRIAIVDEQRMLVDALCLVIQTQPDMCLVGAGCTCVECLELVQQTRPQVLLLNAQLPDGDGIALAPTIKETSPDTNILVLTSFPDDATILRAMQAGVGGFIPKNRNLAEVLYTIRQAAGGEIAIPTGTLRALLKSTSQDHRAAQRSRDNLTPREREILTLLARGQSVEEIAAALVIAPHTVRTHIRNLLQKLGLRSRLQAVTYALKHGLIDPLV